MFLLAVASIIVSVLNVEGGYNYPRPESQLELPNKIFGSGDQSFVGGILNDYKNLDNKKISHSLPNRDYDFLHHKIGENEKYFSNSYNTFSYQNNNFNSYRDLTGFNSRPSTVYGPPKTGQKHHQVPIVDYLQNSGPQEFHVNNVQQTIHRLVPNLMNANHNVPSHLNLQNSFAKVNFGPHLGEHFRQQPFSFNPQSIPNVLEAHDQNIQPVLNLQNDFSSQKTYNPQVNVVNPSLKTQNNLAQTIVGQNTVPPVVTKHIYFHVPPPDIEETSVKPVPPKKSYKIIFIKVPNQESRSIEELQAAYNRLGPIEDKTLIYVLSDNSNSQLVVPTYKPSEHEVLFVKYNGDQNIVSDDNLIEQNDAIYKR